jgi:hypothetical protein
MFRRSVLLPSLGLKKEVVSSSETSAPSNKSTRRYFSQDQHRHFHRSKKLKSQIPLLFLRPLPIKLNYTNTITKPESTIRSHLFFISLFYLTTLSAQATQHRMTGRIVNYGEYRRKRSWPNSRYYQATETYRTRSRCDNCNKSAENVCKFKYPGTATAYINEILVKLRSQFLEKLDLGRPAFTSQTAVIKSTLRINEQLINYHCVHKTITFQE